MTVFKELRLAGQCPWVDIPKSSDMTQSPQFAQCRVYTLKQLSEHGICDPGVKVPKYTQDSSRCSWRLPPQDF